MSTLKNTARVTAVHPQWLAPVPDATPPTVTPAEATELAVSLISKAFPHDNSRTVEHHGRHYGLVVDKSAGGCLTATLWDDDEDGPVAEIVIIVGAPQAGVR